VYLGINSSYTLNTAGGSSHLMDWVSCVSTMGRLISPVVHCTTREGGGGQVWCKCVYAHMCASSTYMTLPEFSLSLSLSLSLSDEGKKLAAVIHVIRESGKYTNWKASLSRNLDETNNCTNWPKHTKALTD